MVKILGFSLPATIALSFFFALLFGCGDYSAVGQGDDEASKAAPATPDPRFTAPGNPDSPPDSGGAGGYAAPDQPGQSVPAPKPATPNFKIWLVDPAPGSVQPVVFGPLIKIGSDKRLASVINPGQNVIRVFVGKYEMTGLTVDLSDMGSTLFVRGNSLHVPQATVKIIVSPELTAEDGTKLGAEQTLEFNTGTLMKQMLSLSYKRSDSTKPRIWQYRSDSGDRADVCRGFSIESVDTYSVKIGCLPIIGTTINYFVVNTEQGHLISLNTFYALIDGQNRLVKFTTDDEYWL